MNIEKLACCSCGTIPLDEELVSSGTGMVCKACFCEESDSNCHEPDFESVALAKDASDSQLWILDVNCKHCGRSGALSIDPQSEVDW